MRLKLNEFKLVEVRNRLFFFSARFTYPIIEREMIIMLNNYMAIRQLKKQLKKDRRELDDLKWELHKQKDENDRESTLFVISIVQERIVETRNELEELVG